MNNYLEAEDKKNDDANSVKSYVASVTQKLVNKAKTQPSVTSTSDAIASMLRTNSVVQGILKEKKQLGLTKPALEESRS